MIQNISSNERGVLEETSKYTAIRRKGNVKRKPSASNGFDLSLTTNSLTRAYSIGRAPLHLVLIGFQQPQAIIIGR